MNKIFVITLLTLSLHGFVLSAPFIAENVFESKVLPKLQFYQNNPPSGYLEEIRCKKGWKFIIVEGEFDAAAKINGKQISLQTVSGTTHFPVGCVMKNGIPFLDYRGYTKGYEEGTGMVFAVPDSEKAHSLTVLSESIVLPTATEKHELTLSEIPEIKIVETTRSKELSFDYKLVPADKKWTKGALDHFHRVVTPVNGDVLTVTMNIVSAEMKVV